MLGAKSPSEREKAPGPLVPRVIRPAFSLTCSAAPSRPGCGPLSARQFMEGSIGKQRRVAFALIDKAENCRRQCALYVFIVVHPCRKAAADLVKSRRHNGYGIGIVAAAWRDA